MLSYTLKARGDAQLHTEGRRGQDRPGDVSYTLKAEEMLSYTLKAGGDGQLHTEGWGRWSATR